MVLRGMARWPDVPRVFGWLWLDRRGRWRLRGETIGNRAACEFIARNYAADTHGRWFFQNGPQRVFVALEAAPLVFGLQPDGSLLAHTGIETAEVRRVLVDDRGDLLLDTDLGPGLLESGDLAAAVERFTADDGRPLDDETLERRLAVAPGTDGRLRLRLRDAALPVEHVAAAAVPALLGFVPRPEPRADDRATVGP